MSKIPVIIDCDPGHDDAIAIMLALASERLDVRAITTVSGNSGLANTTRNALAVLEMCGRRDIPVAAGSAAAILPGARQMTAPEVHGESGLGGPVLPEIHAQPSPLRAVEMMAKVIAESEEPVSIIATGPLTNVAVFLRCYPELMERIGVISVMGGGVEEGNRTAIAEFNIWVDPEAAQIVFTSGCAIELYGLNVTHQALILKDEFELFRNAGGRVSGFVAELLDFFSIYYMGHGGLAGCPMHDPCAVAGMIAPELFDYEFMRLSVDLDGHVTRGAVYMDLRTEPRRDMPYNGKAAIGVDREAMVKLILESVQKLDREVAQR